MCRVKVFNGPANVRIPPNDGQAPSVRSSEEGALRLMRQGSCLKALARQALVNHKFDQLVALCYQLLMSQPVKISDTLMLDARIIGEATERSIAGQIEFWAQLGRAIEPLLQGNQAIALRRAGDAKPVSKTLQTVDSSEGRKRVTEHLKTLPYPHYEQADSPGLLVKIDADGTRTVGRFVNRQFQASKQSRP